MIGSELWRREVEVGVRVLRNVFLPASLLVAAATAIAVWRGRNVGWLFRDPAAIADINPLIGVFSSVGVLAWCTAAAISLFTAALARRAERGAEAWRFFAAGGAFTTVLLLDDFFMLHEMAEESFGVPQYVLAAGYGVALAAYLLAFRRRIAGTHFVILLLAAGWLGFSAAFDVVDDRIDPKGTIPWLVAIEDGAKFLGILGWAAYHVQTAFRYISAAVRVEAAGRSTGAP